MARRESIIGQIVADRFRVLSLLGEGGTGQVYLAEHNVLERQFAIKVLRRDLISDQTAAERFRREARAASRMQHRNIVYISDFGSLPDGRLYLVMEHIPGDELSVVIAREKRLPADRAARILLQVAEALDYAHEKGVVHRDLKAENIILTTERHRRDVVKVLDFGLAKILYGAGNQDTITFKGQIFGTPEYIPPEQITGDPVDQRADIYALGVLTFELVTGRTPFTGTLMELLVAHRKLMPPSPSETIPHASIPKCFDDIVLRAMQKRPDDRFQRASEIGEVLRDYLLSQSQSTHALLDDELSPPVLSRSGVQSTRGSDARTQAMPEPHRDVGPNAMAVTLKAPAAAGSLPPLGGDPDAPAAGRSEAWRLLRARTFALSEQLKAANLASPELLASVEASRHLADRVHEAESELGLLETRLEEVELSGREHESQLRYAIIDLGMAKGRLEHDGLPDKEREAVLVDLQFQIAELEGRLADVARNRESELDELDRSMAEKRRTLEDLQAALTRNDQSSLSLLAYHREHSAGMEGLEASFRELDELGAILHS